MSAPSSKTGRKFPPASLERFWLSFLRINMPERLRLLTGGVLLFMGGGNLLWAFEKTQVLDVPDPVFGVASRYLVLMMGLVGLVLGWLCLFSEKKVTILWALWWMALNFIIYRCGLWTMGWLHPFVEIRQINRLVTLTPWLADVFHLTLCLLPAVAWGIMIWLERRQIQALQSWKISCPACGGHVKFALVNERQVISCPHCAKPMKLRREDNLKMSCFFCQGHIIFPIHALGTKMPCPHCKMDITLKEQG